MVIHVATKEQERPVLAGGDERVPFVPQGSLVASNSVPNFLRHRKISSITLSGLLLTASTTRQRYSPIAPSMIRMSPEKNEISTAMVTNPRVSTLPRNAATTRFKP